MSDKLEERYNFANNVYDSGNHKLAFILFLDLAEEGDSSAMDRIGSMFDAGEGVKYNLKKSIYWYKQAIREGSWISRHNLAITYRCSGDIVKAKYWFEKSIEHGNLDSALDLAKLLMICEGKKGQVVYYLEKCIGDKNGYKFRIKEAKSLLRKYQKQR